MTGGQSWAQRLAEGSLTELQLETLQAMVDNGEADSLAAAAHLLDVHEMRPPDE